MSEPSPLHATVVFDPADGAILQVHFSELATPADWIHSRVPAHARVLLVAPGALDPAQLYRVHPSGKSLEPVASGGTGVFASAGITRPQKSPDSPGGAPSPAI